MTLAEILRTFNIAATPEIVTSKGRPDVRILMAGLKVILEGKTERSIKALHKQARDRLESGMADVSIALSYPEGLSEAVDLEELKKRMNASRFNGVIYNWGSDGISKTIFAKKSIQDLVEVLRHVITLYIRNDLLSSKIAEVDESINELVEEGHQTSISLSVAERKLREALGIGEEDGEEEKD